MGSTGKVLRCAPFFMRTSHIPAPSFGRGRRAQRDGVGFALVRRTGAFSSLPLTIHKNCSEAIIFQPPPWKEGWWYRDAAFPILFQNQNRVKRKNSPDIIWWREENLPGSQKLISSSLRALTYRKGTAWMSWWRIRCSSSHPKAC